MKTETVKRIRTTISITPESHAIFKRMAEAGNMSVSMAMGEWLTDTAEGAEMIVLKMEEAKKAPLRVMRELQSMIAGMSDGIEEGISTIRKSKIKHSSAAPEFSSGVSGVPQAGGKRRSAR